MVCRRTDKTRYNLYERLAACPRANTEQFVSGARVKSGSVVIYK